MEIKSTLNCYWKPKERFALQGKGCSWLSRKATLPIIDGVEAGMARPSAEARLALEHLKDTVIDLMLDMPIWHDAPVESLRQIPLGVLRKNATQRHGVTRWRRGVDLEAMQVSDVEVIDLHPQLLDAQWSAYAAFVLHHEYIHALGFRAHDSTFRKLEAAWPGRAAARHANEFTEALRRARAMWLWVCNECERTYPRQKPSNGRYRCRTCRTVLIDRLNPDRV
jgi:predicted SprT family Zn-dependent metalloprotease